MDTKLLSPREVAIYNAGYNAGVAKTLNEIGPLLTKFGADCAARSKQHEAAAALPQASRGATLGALLGAGIRRILPSA